MKTLAIEGGEITVLEPTVELVQTIRALLPFGLIRHDPPVTGAAYGLVMQCGRDNLSGVRPPPAIAAQPPSRQLQVANGIMIAYSVAAYLKAGFSGLFLPCAYVVKHRQEGEYESGVAYFGYPRRHGRESQEYLFDESFDGDFGHGFTVMVTTFMRAMQESSVMTGLPSSPAPGLNVRERRQLGELDLGFMVVGPHVVCLKTKLEPATDLAWTALHETGISTVYHLPCLPAVIRPGRLHEAKPLEEIPMELSQQRS